MMAAVPRTHWAQIGESTCVAGLWFLYAVHRALGRLPFLLCLYPVVLYYWATRPLARRASIQYLERMQRRHGTVGTGAPWRHSIRHFLSFAETILDKMLALSGRYRFERLRHAGREPLLEMFRRGEGGLIVTAHVGCLELCQASAEREPGFRLNVLVHTRHAERFNRLLRRLDPKGAVQMLQVSEVGVATAAMLADKVRRGEFVAIAGDRVPLSAGTATTITPFLGHGAAFPIGPYVLAALLECPLYMMVCLRERGGHVVHFERLAERVELPRGRRSDAIAAHAATFAARLEARLARAPLDWFNFFPFWEQR
jgi:predicted LPLAT superfamily acyltransferase